MSRKPIGQRPMTSTERSQRRRERLKQIAAGLCATAPDPADATDEDMTMSATNDPTAAPEIERPAATNDLDDIATEYAELMSEGVVNRTGAAWLIANRRGISFAEANRLVALAAPGERSKSATWQHPRRPPS
jgi:hypothetical protein